MSNTTRHKNFETMARAMHNAGIQLVPCIPGTKQPMVKWSQYNKGVLDNEGNHTATLLRNTDQQIESWLENDSIDAFLMVMGSASGNLENLDFDAMGDDTTVYSELLENSAVEAALRDVTPIKSGKGWHNLYYKSESTPKKKLAYRVDSVDGVETLQVVVEALCQGQISMMPYSRHPTGRYYIPVGEPDPQDFVNSIPTLDEDSLETIYIAAMGLDDTGRYDASTIDKETIAQAFEPTTTKNSDFGDGRYSPMYEYNATHDIVELLETNGHKRLTTTLTKIAYARPGGTNKSIEVDLTKNIAVVYGANHPLADKANKNKGIITPYDLYEHYQYAGNTSAALKAISGPVRMKTVTDWSKLEEKLGHAPTWLDRFNDKGYSATTKTIWERTDETFYDNSAILAEAESILAETPTPEKRDTTKGNFSDLMRKKAAIDWIAKGWLAVLEIYILFAESNLGKTFVTVDAAIGLALGESLFGGAAKVSKPVTVVYMASEGQQDFPLRVQAAIQKHKLTKEKLELLNNNFHWNFNTFDFGDTKAVDALIGYYKGMGLDKVVFIFDTYINFLTDGDSTSDPAAIAAMKAMRRLNAEFGGACIVVHHPVKTNQGSAKIKLKGSGYHLANADRVDELHPEGEIDGFPRVKLECVKARGYGFHSGYTGTRLTVDLGDVDEDGDAITSCLMQWDDPKTNINSAKAIVTADTKIEVMEVKPRTPKATILEYAKKGNPFTVKEAFDWNPLGKTLKTYQNAIGDLIAEKQLQKVQEGNNIFYILTPTVKK